MRELWNWDMKYYKKAHLKNGEHGKAKVVEIRNAIIRSIPSFPTNFTVTNVANVRCTTRLWFGNHSVSPCNKMSNCGFVSRLVSPYSNLNAFATNRCD